MSDVDFDFASNPDNKFTLRLLIRHPTIAAAEITKELGLEPSVEHSFGEPRTTPVGTVLDGNYKYTTWSCSQEIRGKRFFFKALTEWLMTLQAAEAFLLRLSREGGSSQLIVHLSGKENIGDVLRWGTLQTLADMKIDVGVEVFPTY